MTVFFKNQVNQIKIKINIVSFKILFVFAKNKLANIILLLTVVVYFLLINV